MWYYTHKHKEGWNMVSLHTMEFIQPHLLWLDLTEERRKLLRHSAQTEIEGIIFSLIIQIKLDLWVPDTVDKMLIGQTYRNTTNSAILMETSDKTPRSSLLFILIFIWGRPQSTANIITPSSPNLTRLERKYRSEWVCQIVHLKCSNLVNFTNICFLQFCWITCKKSLSLLCPGRAFTEHTHRGVNTNLNQGLLFD